MQLSLYNVRLVVGSRLPIKIPVLSSMSGIKCFRAVSFKTEQVNCMVDPNYHFYSLLNEIKRRRCVFRPKQSSLLLRVVERRANNLKLDVIDMACFDGEAVGEYLHYNCNTTALRKKNDLNGININTFLCLGDLA